jgi:hypothetical protein
MIQIFGAKTDPHVESVTQHLRGDGVPFQILDIYDHQSDGFDASITRQLRLAIAAPSLREPLPRVVWWRVKPPFLIATDSIVGYYNQQFATAEWMAVLDYMTVYLNDSIWVNPRAVNRLAGNKIHQLAAAVKAGFSTPRTIFSNNVEAVLQFIEAVRPAQCINKTITPYICPDSSQKYTGFIDADTIRQFSSELQLCPSIFQEHIIPKFELRVTVVGTEIFSAKINKRDALEPDWRKEILDDIYTTYQLSGEFRTKLLHLHAAFGLVYGAYDFIVDRSDNIVFLEVNPAGQWLWLEEKLGLPISNAIARYLTRCWHDGLGSPQKMLD